MLKGKAIISGFRETLFAAKQLGEGDKNQSDSLFDSVLTSKSWITGVGRETMRPLSGNFMQKVKIFVKK